MPRCSATKRNGERCTVLVGRENSYCWQHDPANAEKRHRIAAKAGRSKPNRELQTLKNEVRGTVKAVKDGELDRNDAKVMFSGYALIKDILTLERELRIDDELSAEVEELKREIDANHR